MEFRPSRFEVIPPVVKNLLIINGLMFFATIILGKQGIDLSEHLALYHWSSDKFRVWQLVTHMFMHGNVAGPMADYDGGFMHLFSNMFGLWMFGSILENVFGAKRFLTFYILCGIGASLLHLGVYSYELSVLKTAVAQFQINPTYKQFSSFLSQNHISPLSGGGVQLYDLKQAWEDSPMDDNFSRMASTILGLYQQTHIDQGTVGASGALFGILFAFGFLFPNTQLFLMFIPIPIKAKYFVAFYALFELYSGVKNSAGDNVAHFAHLGGMVIAFIIIKVWNKTNKKDFY